MPQDYPDGMTRMLPGHTVDLENGFARPWYEGSSVVIAAGASGSYTLDFNDDDGIYYIDVVNVSPSAYKEFTVIISINDSPYVCGSVMGFFFFNLRLNPSLLFISGDSVKVEILNLDAAQRTFSVKLQGTKITRPVGFGKCPGAYFTQSLDYINPGDSVTFTDYSDYDPTSWNWDFDDGSVDSSEQNPTHQFDSVGVFYPRLRSINQYGYDTYVSQIPVTVANYQKMSLYTEVDAGDDISLSGFQAVCTAMPANLVSYVYRDFGVSYFTGYTHRLCIKVTGASGNGGIAYFWGLSNVVNTLYNGTGVKVTLSIGYNAGVYTLYAITYNGTSVNASSNHAISVNTYYYVAITHVVGTNVITFDVYTDDTFSTLSFTLTLNHANNNTSFRYLYALSSSNASISSTISAITTDILIT